MTLTEQFRLAIEERELSIERAAGQMGIAVSTLYRWKNDEAQPQGLNRQRLLEWLREPVETFDPNKPSGEFQ